MTLSYLAWLSKIFNDTKHCAASLRQSFLFEVLKPGTSHWQQSWIQCGRRNRQQIDNKVNCCRYGPLCCRFWQQIGNNLNSTVCRGRLCCRYGRLCPQSVYRGQSNTVDLVDFQQSRPCWIQLSPNNRINEWSASQSAVSQLYVISRLLKPGTHWQQSWIQHGRLCWKCQLLPKPATNRQRSTLLPVCTGLDSTRRLTAPKPLRVAQCVLGPTNSCLASA